jgi:ABC-type uncharacterized transport system permease subunit
MAAVAAYLATAITALLIHGIWVAPFIERHGERSTGFLLLWTLAPMALILDYLKARRLCEEIGIRPGWMRWGTLLLAATAVLAACVVVVVLSSIGNK